VNRKQGHQKPEKLTGSVDKSEFDGDEQGGKREGKNATLNAPFELTLV